MRGGAEWIRSKEGWNDLPEGVSHVRGAGALSEWRGDHPEHECGDDPAVPDVVAADRECEPEAEEDGSAHAEPDRNVPDPRHRLHAQRLLGGVRLPDRHDEHPEEDDAGDPRERAEHVEREHPVVEAHAPILRAVLWTSDEFVLGRKSKLVRMAVSSPRSTEAQELLAAARRGDEAAFRRLADEHRAALLAHCYRMLGSLHDAEDALQETLLRAWRGLPGFAGRSAVQSWLYRIATNACLDAIARRSRRVLPVDYGPPSDTAAEIGQPLVESVWIEPFPDEVLAVPDGYAAPEARYEQREAVELAFIAAVQHLPPAQRAVLLLREVLGFSAREAAEALETTVASVNSALQRARRTVEERLPERTQQATLRSLGDVRARELVEAYVDAWQRADVDTLRELLVEDAIFSMPPWTAWCRGREMIANLAKAALETCAHESRIVHARANGQRAIVQYSRSPVTGRFEPVALDVLAFEGSQITEITGFVMPEIVPRFGVPLELDP